MREKTNLGSLGTPLGHLSVNVEKGIYLESPLLHITHTKKVGRVLNLKLM